MQIPGVSPKTFAETGGWSMATVRGWMNRDYVVTRKVGRRRVIMVQPTFDLWMSGDAEGRA